MAADNAAKFPNCILAESLEGRGGKANRKQAKRKCGNCTPFVNVFLLRLRAFEWLKSFHQLIDWDWISCWFSCSAGRQRRFCLQNHCIWTDKHYSRRGNADGEVLNKRAAATAALCNSSEQVRGWKCLCLLFTSESTAAVCLLVFCKHWWTRLDCWETWSWIRNWLVVRCQLRQVCVWLTPCLAANENIG